MEFIINIQIASLFVFNNQLFIYIRVCFFPASIFSQLTPSFYYMSSERETVIPMCFGLP